jgi:hypothetical protein
MKKADFELLTGKLNGFYRGVVEDNNDPLKVGRCRIRVWGVHTEKKNKDIYEGIPISELPWAESALPVSEGAIGGFGVWSVPLQGSHVFCFFENGDPMAPRYFASAPGIQPSTRPNANEGFSDPDGEYPTRLGESDFHRLSRGESDQTAVAYRETDRKLGVPTATGGTWDEPSPSYNAQYPHNFVIATHGGLLIELDSTTGSQRIHIWHPSNSFIEIDKDGNLIFKNNGNRYEITKEEKNEYADVLNITAQRGLSIMVQNGNITITANGGNVDVNSVGGTIELN